MQLVYIGHEIYEVLEKSTEMRAVFLDISKAFDRVWNRGMIAKLRSNGVEGNLLNWYISYLSCRKKRVIIVGVYSDWRYIEAFTDGCFLLEKAEFPGECACKLNNDLRSISGLNGGW